MSEASTTNPAVFTPEAVAAINRAYAEACRRLDGQAAQEHLRFELADRIMFLARSGETDEHRLCSLAVASVLGSKPAGEHDGTSVPPP